MMYGNYGEEGYGAYGRRGVPGSGRRRYRGYSGPEDKLNEMHEHFGAYSESKEGARMGNYAAKDDSIKALDCMLKATREFVEMLDEEADPEEKQVIKKHLRKLTEM